MDYFKPNFNSKINEKSSPAKYKILTPITKIFPSKFNTKIIRNIFDNIDKENEKINIGYYKKILISITIYLMRILMLIELYQVKIVEWLSTRICSRHSDYSISVLGLVNIP